MTDLARSGTSIAVVIPVFNRPKLVIEALESVAKQTLMPSMVFVVDDGSTDATPEAVRNWMSAASLPADTRLLQQANQGVAAARDHGAREAIEAGAKYLAFLDSDDIWPTGFLDCCYRTLDAAESAVAASCDMLDRDQRTGAEYRRDIVRHVASRPPAMVETSPKAALTSFRPRSGGRVWPASRIRAAAN